MALATPLELSDGEARKLPGWTYRPKKRTPSVISFRIEGLDRTGNLKHLERCAFFKGGAKAFKTLLLRVKAVDQTNSNAAVSDPDVPLEPTQDGLLQLRDERHRIAAGKVPIPETALPVRVNRDQTNGDFLS
jgi:hypothetical protein